MTPEQAAKNPYDPFDDSKVWLHADYPLIPVGRFVLNKNQKSYFAEIEQLAFDVAHLIPGKLILKCNTIALHQYYVSVKEPGRIQSSNI